MLDPELLKILLNAGGGFAILAVVIVMSWKRRNGRVVSPPVAASAPNGLTVTYHQLMTLTQDLRALSERLADYHHEARLYYQAGERAAEERHGELKLVVATTINDWRKAREAA